LRKLQAGGEGGNHLPQRPSRPRRFPTKKGSSGNTEESGEAFLLFSLSSFACPKEETRKRHPNQSWPCGLPLLLAGGGTRKNSGFALKQFPRLFPPPPARRGRTNGEFPLARSRAPERLPKRGFALFEAQPSLQSPGSIEEHRVSRLRRDKRHRVPFLWFVSLGKQRNERTDFITTFPGIPG
jgi:hypothetical protein